METQKNTLVPVARITNSKAKTNVADAAIPKPAAIIILGITVPTGRKQPTLTAISAPSTDNYVLSRLDAVS